MKKWMFYTLIYVLIVAVVCVFVLAGAVGNVTPTGCEEICQDNNMTFLGFNRGRCVCSSNLGVYNYFEVLD